MGISLGTEQKNMEFFGDEALIFDKIFRGEQGKLPFHKILQRQTLDVFNGECNFIEFFSGKKSSSRAGRRVGEYQNATAQYQIEFHQACSCSSYLTTLFCFSCITMMPKLRQALVEFQVSSRLHAGGDFYLYYMAQKVLSDRLGPAVKHIYKSQKLITVSVIRINSLT